MDRALGLILQTARGDGGGRLGGARHRASQARLLPGALDKADIHGSPAQRLRPPGPVTT